MAKGREHFALDWIRGELLETLNDAREMLEAYVETNGDGTRMRACLTSLHQVHGTLVMLELKGVTLLADHLERLAQAMWDGRIEDTDAASQTLMQGILELPGHIDEIRAGAVDSPRGVLPLVNDVLAVLGEPALVLEADVTHLTADQSALDRFEGIDGIEKARKIRAAYQQVLLSVLKGEDIAGAVSMLAKVAQSLQRVCEGAPQEIEWRAFGEFVESLKSHQGSLPSDVLKLLRRVDSEIRDLAKEGSESLRKPVPADLVEALLVAAERRGRRGEAIQAIRREIGQAPEAPSMTISGKQALASAAAALREELALVKDKLDLIVRASRQTPEDLSELIAPLKQIGSTLSLLGFESSKTIIADQIDVLNAAAEGKALDQPALLAVASSLVQVDENLASFSQGGKGEAEKITDDAQRAVLTEARAGIEQVKQEIVDFISSRWDARHLQNTGAALAAICGALEMIPLPRASALLAASGRYVTETLIGGPEPGWEMMDHLADAISGVDYYLERLAEDSSFGTDDILDLVERSLSRLGVSTERTPRVRPAASELAEPVVVGEPVVETPREAEFELEIESEGATEEADDLAFARERGGPADRASPEEALREPEKPDWLAEVDLEAEADTEEEPERVLASLPEPTEPVPTLGLSPEEPPVDLEAVGEESEEPALEMDTEGGFDLEAEFFDELTPRPAVREPERTATPATPPVAAKSPEAAKSAVAARPPAAGKPPAAAKPPAGSKSPAAERPRAVPTHTLLDTFESDAEIVEIFVEEVSEVLENVDAWMPRWRAAIDSDEALTEVRRAFHTLKGSGRIVGANVIGEVAWSVENMLNRLIDGTVSPNAQFLQVVDEARALIPQLKDAFEVRTAPDMAAVAQIMEHADVLASGGTLDESALAEPVAAPAPVEVAEDESAESLEVFVGEARGHLGVLGRAITPAGFRLSDVEVRALHTLAGSAGMAGIDSVADLARPTYELASLLRGDLDKVVDGEFADFLCRSVEALAQTVADLGAGIEPEDQLQLVAEVDHLLVAAARMPEVEEAGAAHSALMGLEGLAVIMDASEYLRSWHEGAMDLEFGDKLQHALDEVGSVAAAESQQGIARLCRALGAAHERLAHEMLSDDALAVLERGQERLLGLFDALAAEQTPQSVDDAVAELEGLLELVVFEELDTEPPPARGSANVVGLPREPRERIEEPPPREPPRVVSAEEKAFSLEELSDDMLADIERETASSAAARAEAPEAEARESAREATPARAAATPAPARGESKAPELPAEVAELLPDEVDAEIIEVFFEEADELLEGLDSSIEQWSTEPGNRLHLEHMLRGLHTLKGGARLSGLAKLGDATHQFESFLIDVQNRDAPADERFFADLHGRFDEIAGMVQLIRRALAGEAVEAPAPRRAHTEAPAQAPAARGERAPARAEGRGEREAPKTAEVRPIKPAAAAAVEPEKADRAGQEMVRVGSSLLETLVNLAGESSIIRARVEQGISDFTNSLDEMETTIERLREQLRRLEIETEAQILFRQDRPEGPAYAEFDPLEMDRYSQLQQLSRGLSESASDMLDLKETLLFKARESETLLLQQARINTELQEGLMRTRMVPFSRLLPRLKRIVRQVAGELGKQVELHAYNAEGELDRSLLERMVPPLEHMLRNAVDHGIESTELRKNYGKPAVGRIDLRLSREGGDVVIEIADDGAGIDVESVRAKAIERGLMAEGAALRDDEIVQFVLAPGFSTAKSVTQISGRGVGMDVVHSEVKQLGGSIQIASRPGKGSRFILRVPFTVSVNRALMVSVGEDLYAIPLNNIEGIVLLSPEELERLYAPDGNTFEYAGIPYRVRYLGHYIGREFRAANQPHSIPVVLVRSGDHAVAVHVDSVQGSREIVVKSLGPQFAGVGGISGATILGDGSVVVILDLLALIRAQGGDSFVAAKRPLAGGARTRCVMVVDDSVTVRKVTSRLLERQGMDVIVAKDGVEAIALLQERRPDVMLLDIEMPRMDGFEVARQVRHDERLKDLPIVMISSRTGEKHQEHAAQLGVNSFLGKPFQENELLATIDRLVD